MPRLDGAQSLGAQVLADKAVTAKWRMGDGSVLRIDLNLSEATVPAHLQTEHLLFDSRPQNDTTTVLTQGLPAFTALVSLIPAGDSETAV